jgi:hypothetical protein
METAIKTTANGIVPQRRNVAEQSLAKYEIARKITARMMTHPGGNGPGFNLEVIL